MEERVIHLSDEDKRDLQGAIKEIANLKVIMESNKEAVKEIIDNLHEKYDLDKKYIRQLANTYYKKNFSEVKNGNDFFENLYSMIFDEEIVDDN